MKHSKVFSTLLCIFLILCSALTLASEHQHHHTHVFSPQHNTTTSNIAFSAHLNTRVDANNHYRSSYPTPKQLAIVTGWMKQLYPDNMSIAIPQKIPFQQQQHAIRTAQQTPPIQKTVVITPEVVIQQTHEATHITQLEDQFFVYQQCPEWDKHTDVIDRRIDALQQIKNGDQQHTTQHYTISEKMQHYCDAHVISTNALEQCEGDILQQTMHDEFVHITKKNANIWHKNKYPKAFKKATAIIADFTDAGIAFNLANETCKALALADACWMILDCIQAAGEGLLEGAYHTVDDIIHPIRTVQNIAESIATCGYYIGKVAIEIGELGYLVVAEPPEKTYQKLDTWTNTFAVIYDAIKEKSSSLKVRDAIKETVSFGTQLYTTPKALHGIGKLFKYAHKHVIKMAAMPHAAKSNVLTTPEGIIVRIADSTFEYMKNAHPQQLNSSFSIPKFIQENRIPIDKETILSHSNFRKTKIPTVKGAQVYTKDNLFYHRDTLHKGKRAHLEVYDKRGLHLGEADPITGELIKNTADKMKKLFR